VVVGEVIISVHSCAYLCDVLVSSVKMASASVLIDVNIDNCKSKAKGKVAKTSACIALYYRIQMERRRLTCRLKAKQSRN